MKTPLLLLFKALAITGNVLFILWVSVNAIKDHFSGNIYQRLSFVALTILLISNCLLIIRSFKTEAIHQS